MFELKTDYDKEALICSILVGIALFLLVVAVSIKYTIIMGLASAACSTIAALGIYTMKFEMDYVVEASKMFELEFNNKKILSFVGLTLVLTSFLIIQFVSVPLGLLCAGVGAVAMALGVEQDEIKGLDESDKLEEIEGDNTND